MSSTAGTRIGVIVNPTSGRGKGLAAGKLVFATLQAAGVDSVDLSAESMDAALAAGRHAIANKAVTAIVVVGGDGMAHLGANLCALTGIPLGIVGVGTGNDSARSLGFPVDDAEVATRFIIERLSSTRPIDAIKLHSSTGQHWVLGTASAGFDALVNQRANQMSWPKGPRRYEIAMLLELAKFKPLQYELEIDGQNRKIEAMLCAVANAPAFGGGMLVAPEAKMDDGLLDVFIVHKISRAELVKIFPSVYTGGHVTHPAVEFVRAKHVKINSGQMPAYADGEAVGRGPLQAELVAGALQVFG
ncbi:MAG: sphingosine kinase [Actinomycetales bacterium]|nr:sphingosine kinase [Actinomycetales bacterium]